jgi:hypothetical protein
MGIRKSYLCKQSKNTKNPTTTNCILPFYVTAPLGPKTAAKNLEYSVGKVSHGQKSHRAKMPLTWLPVIVLCIAKCAQS